MAGPKSCQRWLAAWICISDEGLTARREGLTGPRSARLQADPWCARLAFTIGPPTSRAGGCNGPGRSLFLSAPFADFMILTDFSRCQGCPIGRVSRRLKRPSYDTNVRTGTLAATTVWL